MLCFPWTAGLLSISSAHLTTFLYSCTERNTSEPCNLNHQTFSKQFLILDMNSKVTTSYTQYGL